MLLKDQENADEFVKLFRKKFDNFCTKAPILLSYQVDKLQAVVVNVYTKAQQLFLFDMTLPVTENIKIIKDWLLDSWYPVIKQELTLERELTTEETEELIESGVSPEKAVLATHRDTTMILWRLEKVLIRKDEVFIRNMKTDKFYRFKMHMPVTIFLKRLRERYNQIYAWQVFENKSELLNEIYSNYKERLANGEFDRENHVKERVDS